MSSEFYSALETHEYYHARLRRLLARYFSLEELKTLSFDIGVDFDELGGDSKTSKIRELILYLERQNKLDVMVTAAKRAYPQIQWRQYAEHDFPCPYRGLLPFKEQDAHFFFGREKFTEQLVTAVHQQNLVAVVGSSGSGKSSVVFAGLLPYLRQQNKWIIASFRPGKQPFHELSKALIPLLESQMSETQQLSETRKLGQTLKQGNIPLVDVLHRILQKYTGKNRLLLVVDQFEELYTNYPDSETRQHFLDMLLTTADHTQVRTRNKPAFTLLLVMRGDFMGNALAYRPLADALQNSDIKLGPMTLEELKVAIRRPAEESGLRFETGLVQRILDDIVPSGLHQTASGNLPLLEFALEQLWELRTIDGRLTHQAYEAIGEVEGAISQYADEIYEGLAPPEQANIRRVLVQMVYPGDTEDTRRLVTRSEIGNSYWPLVKQLAEDRLIVMDWDGTGQEIAEVIHEALIQKWSRMQDWMAQDRNFRIWQERMRTSLSQWQKSQSDEDLLSGSLLSLSREWLQKRPESLNRAETDFIHRSMVANRALKRRLTVALILAGGIGAAIAAASVAALAGYFLWQPDSERFSFIPRFTFVFLVGLQGGLLGGVQGIMTTLGLIVADMLTWKPSRYVRVLSGMAFGGIVGSFLFILFRAAESFPPGLSFGTVLIAGFVIFALSSGGASLVVPADFGKPNSLLRQTIMGTFAAGAACFIATWSLYNLIDLSAADEFLPTVLGYTALESMFSGGMNFGLSIITRLRYIILGEGPI